MKRFKIKTTSKISKIEVFHRLSNSDLNKIKGGNNETPPDEEEVGTSNS